MDDVRFTLKVKKEHLENLVKGLSEKNLYLMAENQDLKKQIEHLEVLLKNAPVKLVEMEKR